MLKVEPLDASHDRNSFDCGSEPLNGFLKQIARQHVAKGISKTFVLVDEDSPAPQPILGFFAVSLCQVLPDEVPAKWAKRLPKQIPAMRLGRLAVAKSQQGKGYGKALLFDAITRVAAVGAMAGGIGLFVDAKDEAVASYYAGFGIEPAPSSPLTLFLPMETLRQLVDAG